MKRVAALLIMLCFVLAAGVGTTPVQAQTVNWVYASGYAPTHPQMGLLAEEWIAKVEELTEGRVRIRAVHGGALLPAEEVLPGVRRGIADVGSLVTSFWPGELRITTALASTVDVDLGNRLDMAGVLAITLQLLEEFEEFRQEYQRLGVTPLLWVPTPPYALISREPLVGFDDLRGKRIRTFGTNMPVLLDAAGAVPMSVAFGEIFVSLQTGVIDAAYTDPPAIASAGFQEVAKHLLLTGPGHGALTLSAPVVYVINNRSLDRLSEQDRATLLQVSREMTLASARAMEQAVSDAIEQLKAAGVTVRNLSPGDAQRWSEASPDWPKLVADTLNQAGLPGTAIMERYLELAEAYLSGEWDPWAQ